MKSLVLLIPALCLLSACGDASHPPSVLQRFDGMATRLDSVTSTADVVSTDLATVSAYMARAQPAAVRVSAARLERDATLLKARAGSSGGSTHALLSADKNPVQHHYLRILAGTLTDQWMEARVLEQLANLVWHDPLMLERGHVARLKRLSRSAQWYAWRSVQLAATAARWHAAHIHSFRYVPVIPTVRVASGPFL